MSYWDHRTWTTSLLPLTLFWVQESNTDLNVVAMANNNYKHTLTLSDPSLLYSSYLGNPSPNMSVYSMGYLLSLKLVSGNGCFHWLCPCLPQESPANTPEFGQRISRNCPWLSLSFKARQLLTSFLPHMSFSPSLISSNFDCDIQLWI